MNMPKDTKGTAPDDVEAHGFRLGSDEAQATEQRDTGQDVEGHRWRAADESQTTERDSGEDVEGHGARYTGIDESQATEQGDSGEDVEGHFISPEIVNAEVEARREGLTRDWQPHARRAHQSHRRHQSETDTDDTEGLGFKYN